MCRSRTVEECRKRSPNVCHNRQKVRRVSRQYSDSSTCNGDSYPSCGKKREDAVPLPVKDKINGDKKGRKHSRPANSTLNTDNRRMTGNVNIYICSAAGGNGQVSRDSIIPFSIY